MFKIFIALFLIAGAVLVFFVRSESYFVEIKSLRKQVSSYNETINTAKKIRSSIDKTLLEYNGVSQENVDKIKKMVPSEDESMELVVQIDDMMRKNGLTLKAINIKDVASQNSSSDSPKNDGKIAESVFLSMNAQGSYESFRSFIKGLEKSLRLIDVVSVSINPGDQNNYSFSIESVSYWRKTGGET